MADIRWFINNGDYYYFKSAPKHLSGVSLDKNGIYLATVGQTEQLTATPIPANAVETVSLNWSSSDTSIATVDNTGLVTCVTPGECTITVTTTPGSYTASCSVQDFPYKYVEYIQSTATSPGDVSSSGQYIDTLVTINKNIKVEIDMQFTSLAVQSRLFGGLYDSGSSGITFGPYINGSTQWARATANGLGNWQSTNVAANSNRNKFVLDNTRYIIYNSSGTQVYNGTNSSTISNSDTWTIPLLASKDRTQNKVNRHSSAKLYGCKIWDNNVLVRELKPCYRKSDSVIGMYDVVNDVFYTNAGTGTFTKGPDV